MNLSQNTRTLNFRSNILASSALVAASIFPIATAKAAPQGGLVVGGSATITVNGSNTRIDQSTNRAAIDWQSFNVRNTESVTFYVPQAGATLNRVVGMEPSLIQGSVTSNGSLYFVNPNGLVFDVGSHVTAQNFVATTSNIDPAQFMRGGAVVMGRSPSNARISLNGEITVGDRGVVGIFAPQVVNQGTITANLGTVTLAGAQASVIDFNGDGLMSFEVGATTSRAGEKIFASNSGVINVGGGVVTLTAQGADDLFNALVSNSGTINAATLSAKGGVVTLLANSGDVIDSGSIDASGVAGGGSVMVWAKGNTDFTGNIKAEALAAANASDGGAVEVSGLKSLKFRGKVSTLSHNGGKIGSLLLDPTDIEIVASAPADNTVTNIAAASNNFTSTGTDKNSYILTADLVAALGMNNVTVDATTTGNGGGTGSITVSSAIEWASSSSLKLKSSGAMNINANIKSTNATHADLILESGGAITQANTGSVITVGNLSGSAVGDISLVGSNRIDSLGAITANNITIRNSVATTLKGDLTTTSTSTDAKNITTNNGTISITGNSFALGSNVTLTAATSTFDTGSPTAGAFTTGNTHQLTSASGDVYIIASAITLSTTAGYKSINVGTGTLHTAVGDGELDLSNNDSDLTNDKLTINQAWWNSNFTGRRAGYKLSTDDLTHVTGNYTSGLIKITANSIILAGSPGLSPDSKFTVYMKSTQGSIETDTGISSYASSLTLDSATTISIEKQNIALTSADTKLILKSVGDIKITGLTTPYISATSNNGNIIISSINSNVASYGTGGARVVRIGNISAGKNIEIRATTQLSLEGDLITENGAGNIYISTRTGVDSRAIKLGANITTNGRLTLDLGGSNAIATNSTFYNTGYFGTVFTLDTSNKDVAIIANAFNLTNNGLTGSTKAINVGTGTFYTGSLGGNLTSTDSVTIDAGAEATNFLKKNYIFDYASNSNVTVAGLTGFVAFNNNNNTRTSGVSTTLQDVTITAPSITVSQMFNYMIGNNQQTSNVNARNFKLIATSTGDGALTVGGFTTNGNLTLQSAGGIDINAVLTVSGSGILNIIASADVASTSIITANSLTANLTGAANATADLNLSGANLFTSLGSITASSINIRNNQALNLNGDLKTASNSGTGLGLINISTSGKNITLTRNVTTDARTTIFSLGNSAAGGTFNTGNFTLSSTNNQNISIVAHQFSYGTPAGSAKSINLGLGVLSTTLGGGTRNFTGDIVVNSDFMAANSLNYAQGYALTQAEIDAHVQLGEYVSQAEAVTINATGIVTVDGLTYADGLDFNINGGSIVMGSGSVNSFNKNLTLKSDSTITFNTNLTLSNASPTPANATLTMSSKGNINATNGAIIANTVTVTASNQPGAMADVNLTNANNQITNLGAITGTSIDIANSINTILKGDLKTLKNSQLNASAPITSTVGGGAVTITATDKNISLGANLTIYGNNNALIMAAAGGVGTFSNSNNNVNYILTVANNQNLKILAAAFTLVKPLTSNFAIDVGTGVLSTFDAGEKNEIGAVGTTSYLGNGTNFGLTTAPAAANIYKTDGALHAKFNFGTQRIGAAVNNAALVNQSSDSAAKLAAIKSNVIHVLGDANFSKFNLVTNALTRDLTIIVDGNVTFAKESDAGTPLTSAVSGANFTVIAGKAMTVNQQVAVTGGSLTLSGVNGVTVNNVALNSTQTAGANGNVYLNGGFGSVVLNSGGVDYTIDKNTLTVTGALFEVNLSGVSDGGQALNGKLKATNGAKIDSSAVNMSFLGSATGNDIKIINGTNGVTYINPVDLGTAKSVMIDKNYALPTISLTSASTGISLINADGTANNQSLTLGLKFDKTVAVTINDNNNLAANVVRPATNFATLTWIEGGSINITANTVFNKQLVLRASGNAVKMANGFYSAIPDIYANIYIGGTLTTGGGLILNVNTGSLLDVNNKGYAVTPTLTNPVTSASSYGVYARGNITINANGNGGDLNIIMSNNVKASGSMGAAASVALAGVTVPGKVLIATNGDVTSAGNADADGIVLNGAIKSGGVVIINQLGAIRALGIGTATGVNINQLITTGSTSGNVIVTTGAASSAASAAGSVYGIKLSSINAGGYVSLNNNMGGEAFSYPNPNDPSKKIIETGLTANYLKLSVGFVSAYGIYISGGVITTKSVNPTNMLGLSLVNNANVTMYTSPLTLGSNAIGIYGAGPFSAMDIKAGGLLFDNEGNITSMEFGNNKRGFNARGIDLSQNLKSVSGQDITLTQKGTIAAKTSGEGVGIVVRGVVNSGHDFIVTQNGNVTSAYQSNAIGYQQVGSVTAANDVKINESAGIQTHNRVYAFGSAYGIYMNNAVTAGGNISISNKGASEINSEGTGSIGIQTQALTAQGAVTITNDISISLSPKSSNYVPLSAYGILLGGNITAGSDVKIYNGSPDAPKGALSVNSTPDNIASKIVGVGSKYPILITSNAGAVSIANNVNLLFNSDFQTVSNVRGIDLFAFITTRAKGQNISISNNAGIYNEGGNGDATGVYLQGSLNSAGNIIVSSMTPVVGGYYDKGMKSYYGSAAGVVVGAMTASGNITLTNDSDISANQESSAISNVEADGVKITGFVRAGGNLNVTNNGSVQAKTLGQPYVSYTAYGIKIIGGGATAATINLKNNASITAIDTSNNSISNINASAYGIDINGVLTTTGGDLPSVQGSAIIPSVNINVANSSAGNSTISAYGRAVGVNINGVIISAGQVYANVGVTVQDISATVTKDNLLTGSAVGIAMNGYMSSKGNVTFLVNHLATNNNVSSIHGSATGISQLGYITAVGDVTETVGGKITGSVTKATGLVSSGGVSTTNGAINFTVSAPISANTDAAGIVLNNAIISGNGISVTLSNSVTSRSETGNNTAVGVSGAAYLQATKGNISIRTLQSAISTTSSSAYANANGIVLRNTVNALAGTVTLSQSGAVSGRSDVTGVTLYGAILGANGIEISQSGNVSGDTSTGILVYSPLISSGGSVSVTQSGEVNGTTGASGVAINSIILAGAAPSNPFKSYVAGSATIRQTGKITTSGGNAYGVSAVYINAATGIIIDQNGTIENTGSATYFSTNGINAGALISSNGAITLSTGANTSMTSANGTAIGINLTGSVVAGNAVDVDTAKVSTVGVSITQNASVSATKNSATGINAVVVNLVGGLAKGNTSGITITNNGQVTATQSAANMSVRATGINILATVSGGNQSGNNVVIKNAGDVTAKILSDEDAAAGAPAWFKAIPNQTTAKQAEFMQAGRVVTATGVSLVFADAGGKIDITNTGNISNGAALTGQNFRATATGINVLGNLTANAGALTIAQSGIITGITSAIGVNQLGATQSLNDAIIVSNTNEVKARATVGTSSATGINLASGLNSARSDVSVTQAGLVSAALGSANGISAINLTSRNGKIALTQTGDVTASMTGALNNANAINILGSLTAASGIAINEGYSVPQNGGALVSAPSTVSGYNASAISLNGNLTVTNGDIAISENGNVTGVGNVFGLNAKYAAISTSKGNVSLSESGIIKSTGGSATAINQQGSISASGNITISSAGSVITSNTTTVNGIAAGVNLTNLTSYQGIKVTQAANISNLGNSTNATVTGNANGLILNGKIWSAGSITASETGNIAVKTGSIAKGIVLSGVTATARNDVTFTQSGTIQDGTFNAATEAFTAAASQDTAKNIAINVASASSINAGGADFSWVTFRTDNLNLKLDGGLTITNAEIRIDLNKTAQSDAGANKKGQLDVGVNRITATNRNLYYTGSTTAIFANNNTIAIDLGSTAKTTNNVTSYSGGNFTMVENIDGTSGIVAPTLGTTTATPTWVIAGGNRGNNGGNQYIGASTRGALALSGATNINLRYVEGSTVSVAAGGASYSNNFVINTIGGAGAAGAFTAKDTLTTAGRTVSVYTHGGNFLLSGDATITSSSTATNPAPTITLNLGGVDNGGRFTNASFTLSTGDKNLTVLAGNWTLNQPTIAANKAINVGAGTFSEGGKTIKTGDFIIDANFSYQGGADILATDAGLITAASTQDNNITAEKGNIIIRGVNGLNMGKAAIVATAGTISVFGVSNFATSELTLKSSGNLLITDGMLNLFNGDLVLNSNGAINAYTAINAKNVTVAMAGGNINLVGYNAINNIVSIKQKAATSSQLGNAAPTYTANNITILNSIALTMGAVTRTTAVDGVTAVTAVGAITPAGNVTITTLNSESDLALTGTIGNLNILTVNSSANLGIATAQTSNGAVTLTAVKNLTTSGVTSGGTLTETSFTGNIVVGPLAAANQTSTGAMNINAYGGSIRITGNSTAIGSGSININAGNDATITGALTSNGNMTLNAKRNLTHIGIVAGDVTISGGSYTATAGYNLSDNKSVTTQLNGATAYVAQFTRGVTFNAGNNLNIADVTSVGSVTETARNGSITITGENTSVGAMSISAYVGSVTVTATGSLNATTLPSLAGVYSAPGTLTITAGGDMTISGKFSSASHMNLTAGNNFTYNSTAATSKIDAGGNLTIFARNDLTANQSLNSGALMNLTAIRNISLDEVKAGLALNVTAINGNISYRDNQESGGAMTINAGGEISSPEGNPNVSFTAKDPSDKGNNRLFNISASARTGSINLTGVVTANKLTASSGGSINISYNDNNIASFGNLISGNGIYVSSTATTVQLNWEVISGKGDATINAKGKVLKLDTNVLIPSGNLKLFAQNFSASNPNYVIIYKNIALGLSDLNSAYTNNPTAKFTSAKNLGLVISQ